MTWSSKPSGRKQRLPSNWAALRRAVFARDGDVCHVCHDHGADTIDHVIAGDNHDLSNLAPIHDRNAPHCHRAKTAREALAARPTRRRPPERHPGLR